MDRKMRVTPVCFFLLLALLACRFFSPEPKPMPEQLSVDFTPTLMTLSPVATQTSTSPTETQVLVLSTATLPTQTPRPTRTATPAPEWMTDFAEPILAYISNHPPDMGDNFGYDTGAWMLASWSAEWRKSIRNGEMILEKANVQYQGIKFHDYVVQVKTRQIAAGWHGIEFSNAPRDWELGGMGCTFMLWSENAFFGCGSVGEQTDVSKQVTFRPKNSLTVIVKGGRIATYLNEQPFGYFEDDRYRLYRGTLPYVGLFSSNVHAFSEFKVWNITKFEIPASGE
jgi:hypothetical protein